VIGRLRGILAEAGEDEALIDVGGVGYVVRCGSRALGRMPPVGDEVLLHIESQWSESMGLRLYGFLTREERRAFVMLQEIQGVGPKAALAVLDILSPAELAHAAAHEDKAAVARASGVGPKLALRIVTELKGKPIAEGLVITGAPRPTQPIVVSAAGEAVAALLGLGVAEVNARRVVDQAAIRLGEDAAVSALVKAALQELGR
jgi:Holliday junction DNA helicase RuvA